MAKSTTKAKAPFKPSASKAAMRIKHPDGASKVQFGVVIVEGPKVSKQLLAKNVKVGSDSLKRMAKTVAHPGVVIRAKRGVPQFFVDVDRPGYFVRRLDGKMEHGQVVGGKFVVVD